MILLFYVMSQWATLRRKEGYVYFAEVREDEVFAQRTQALNTNYSLSNLLNWIILRNDSPCKRSWCYAVRETRRGQKFCLWPPMLNASVTLPCRADVVRSSRRKPDLKMVWFNPTNTNWIPTSKGPRKQKPSPLEGCAPFPATSRGDRTEGVKLNTTQRCGTRMGGGVNGIMSFTEGTAPGWGVWAG